MNVQHCQKRHAILDFQSNVATLVKLAAEEWGLHGTCWVVAFPKSHGDTPKSAFITKGLFTPSCVLIGDSYKDTRLQDYHLFDEHDAENHIGAGACKIAKMIDTGLDSNLLPYGNEGEPALIMSKTHGEDNGDGGKIYHVGDYIVLIALASNNPDVSNDIIEIVAQKWERDYGTPWQKVIT